jgi:hypothetical protein
MNDDVDVRREFDLQLAPRYTKNTWRPGEELTFTNLAHRLAEFSILYNMTPPDHWWGWSFWWDEV